MNKPKRSRDGRWLDDYVVDEGGLVHVPLALADGYRRDLVDHFATDTLAVHKPGFRTATHVGDDHQRKAGAEILRDGARQARDTWLQQMSDAWRMDAKRKPPDDDDDDDEDDLDREVGADRARAIRARRGMIDRAANAWRDAAPQPANIAPGPRAFVEQVGSRVGNGPGIPGPGPASTLPAPTAGPAPERPDPNNAQAKRDAAWRSYRDQLSTAWRGMGPSAAGPSLEWKGAGT
jgi:hypothetical protein